MRAGVAVGGAAAALALAVLAVVEAPRAAADAGTGGYLESIRWSGWIAAHKGVRFDDVSASWHVPGAHCKPHGKSSYSLAWIGLGGSNENELEQVGTETDCSGFFPGYRSRPLVSVWWEVLPQPQQYPITTVHVGDLVDAAVSARGRRVRLSLTDVTHHATFVKTVRPRHLTETSADWIVEDPEICPGSTIHLLCPSKRYAPFERTTFSNAAAGTTAGRHGPIADPHWAALRYALINDRNRLLSWPTPLNAAGTGFSVSRTNRVPPGEPPPPV
jgi:hypothetical protein